MPLWQLIDSDWLGSFTFKLLKSKIEHCGTDGCYIYVIVMAVIMVREVFNAGQCCACDVNFYKLQNHLIAVQLSRGLRLWWLYSWACDTSGYYVKQIGMNETPEMCCLL